MTNRRTPRSTFRLLALFFAIDIVVVGAILLLWRPINDWFIRSQGFGESFNSYLARRLQSGDYGKIDSFLIWHNGELVTEQYFNGYDQNTLHPVYSVTKSVTSMVYGAAYADGHSLSRPSDTTPYNDAIRVEHLMTMTAGYEWDEITSALDDPINNADQMESSRDWIEYVSTKPLVDQPGDRFTYNSGLTVMLGDVFQQDVGMPIDDYAAEALFKPLGIERWEWQRSAIGQVNTGYGLQMTPADMLKLGRLMLQNGEWEGETLIEPDWISESTTPYVTEDSWLHYGYMWWLPPESHSVTRHADDGVIWIANGYQEQYIVIVPSLDLVVVSTAESRKFASMLDLLDRLILPAAKQTLADSESRKSRSLKPSSEIK